MKQTKANLAQDRLCKELGKRYSIRCIDGERCIYCDFGNNFDVEISRTNTARKHGKAIIYLWYKAAFTVARIDNVQFSKIADAVEMLYRYTCRLHRDGVVTDNDLYRSTSVPARGVQISTTFCPDNGRGVAREKSRFQTGY